MGMIEIRIHDREMPEPKVYRKAIASDQDLFALLDRAAAKFGSPADPDEPRRYARALAIARQGMSK